MPAMDPKAYQGLLDILRSHRPTRAFRNEALPAVVLEKLSLAFNLSPALGDDHSAALKFFQGHSLKPVEAMLQELWQGLSQIFPSDVARGEIAKFQDDFATIGRAQTLAAVSARKTPPYLFEALGQSATFFWGRELSAAMATQNLIAAAESLQVGAALLAGPMAFASQIGDFIGLGKGRTLVAFLALGWPAK
jgi:nitroreductase